MNRKSKITNIGYNPSNEKQIILHDEQMFCILDKTQVIILSALILLIVKDIELSITTGITLRNLEYSDWFNLHAFK